MARARAYAAGLAAVAALAGCETGVTRSPVPQPRPVAAPAPAPAPQSAASLELQRYYTAVQNDLLARGLLRTDGGGPDTPYDADDLVENFIAIAFYDEYQRGSGTALRGQGQTGRLSRWSAPVRIGVEFGASVPEADRAHDRKAIAGYADRLARVTGHSIGMGGRPNFHVFVAGEDDRAFFLDRLAEIAPRMSASEMESFRNLPRSIYCLVVAFSGGLAPQTYTQAVALIRAEHPDLVRLSCIHEEIAQGLGLANDSPYARPSIFNDDDEFALLTSHDEMLLRMLYDPRLKTGMSAEAARPVARIVARELLGAEL